MLKRVTGPVVEAGRKLVRGVRRGCAGVNRALPAPVKGAAVAAGAFSVQAAHATGFDVTTLYLGADTAFEGAATIAGGFLAIKFGAKMIKKAWAWLT